MGISIVSLFPVQSRGSLTVFPVYLGVVKLALNWQNFLHVLGVALELWLIGQVYGRSLCLYIFSMFRCPSFHLYVCTSVIPFVYLSVHLYIYHCIHTSVSTLSVLFEAYHY